MISKDIRRATLVALGVGAAMAASSAWAQSPDQAAKDAQVDTGEEMGVITVTGSRTITDNALSPTPLTTVDIRRAREDHAQRHRPTPSTSCPAILGGRTPRTQGNGSTNNGGNTLSLRNFGT
jgi:hypothetical protein